MNIITKHFGEIEIDEDKIINFPEGVPGFEQIHRFIIIKNTDEESPFNWLQGVDDPQIAFVIIDPKIIMADYIVEVEDDEVDILKISDSEKVAVYCIVMIPEEISKMTANLKAPILINTENSIAKQVVVDKSQYLIKHYIAKQTQKVGGME